MAIRGAGVIDTVVRIEARGGSKESGVGIISKQGILLLKFPELLISNLRTLRTFGANKTGVHQSAFSGIEVRSCH